jgi:hypothetical protein
VYKIYFYRNYLVFAPDESQSHRTFDSLSNGHAEIARMAFRGWKARLVQSRMLITARSNRISPTRKKKHMSYHITEEWTFEIDDTFKHRIDEESNLVFWKPGRTVYLIVWNRPQQETKEQTLAWIKAESDPNPLLRIESGTVNHLRYGYLLQEHDNGRKYFAFYGFSIADTSCVQSAFYYDDQTDLEWAKATWLSLTYQSNEEVTSEP